MARPADPRRRETILRAATEVFTEQGFSETRLADIAQRAGVVISTLYLYFGSKEEVVHAIAQENQHILLDQLGPVLVHLIPIRLPCGKIKETTRWKGMKNTDGTSNHPSGLTSVCG